MLLSQSNQSRFTAFSLGPAEDAHSVPYIHFSLHAPRAANKKMKRVKFAVEEAMKAQSGISGIALLFL
jgi:hypothetical protein